jgi:nucleoside-diphosphate-sugar epimerase
MNILVTGGAGYLGSVLLPKLLARGHRVRVIDLGYFGVSHLSTLRPGIELIREDIRLFREDRKACNEALENIDCVIHLAAISNDPSAELNPKLTEQVNFEATRALAEAAKAKRIRFIFSSSCSVYGQADGEIDETCEVNPLTTYARSKVNSDRLLESIATASWRPIILRNGTLYGYSPRMRFDLVINIFGYMTVLQNELPVFGEGLQWRPFLHISDCARAFVHFAEAAETEHVMYNIAHENLRVIDLIQVFKQISPGVKTKFLPAADVDSRNYRVSTRRMQSAGFQPLVDVRLGAEEVVDALVSGAISDPESIFHRNAKWMKELSQFGDTRHKEFVGLMERMAAVIPQKH